MNMKHVALGILAALIALGVYTYTRLTSEPPSMISTIPMLVTLALAGVIGMIVMMWYLSKTKAATTEARLGQFEIIVLPSGDRITGLTSLARGLVKQQFTTVLAQAERLTAVQAKDLNKAFDDLYFYGVSSGRGRFLIISDKNIEDPDYSIPLDEVFELPFGYVTRRLVVADGVSTERAGWKVYTLAVRNIKTEIVGKQYETMINIADAAACVREAAIRIQKEMPWREVALAREKQLGEAYVKIADISHENSDLKLALANKPLLEREAPPKPQITAKAMSWGRIIWSVIVGGGFLYFSPMVKPDIGDPTMYAIGVGFVLFIFYPWISAKLRTLF
jgi:hypothetical protein